MMRLLALLWHDFWRLWHGRRAEALQMRVARHIAALKRHMRRAAR